MKKDLKSPKEFLKNISKINLGPFKKMEECCVILIKKHLSCKKKNMETQHLRLPAHLEASFLKIKQTNLFRHLLGYEEQMVKLLLFSIFGDISFSSIIAGKEFLPIPYLGHISEQPECFTKYIDLVYLHVVTQVDSFFKSNLLGITLSPDGCTDLADNNVVNVIGIAGEKAVLLLTHFIEGAADSTKIKMCLNMCLQQFKIDKNQIHAVTRDSTAYMEKVCKDFIFENEIPAHSVPCSSHLLNSTVKDIVHSDEIKTLLSHVRNLFTKQAVERKRSWSDFLESYQIYLRAPNLWEGTRAWMSEVDLLVWLVEEFQIEGESTTVVSLLKTFLF